MKNLLTIKKKIYPALPVIRAHKVMQYLERLDGEQPLIISFDY